MYPLKFSIEYPEKLSRGILFLRLFFGFLYVGIPHGVVLFFLFIGLCVVNFIAFWVILFTGKVPKGMFDYVIGVYRWCMRVAAYLMYMTDKYPAFSLKPIENDPVVYELEYPEKLSRGKLILKVLLGWIYVMIPHYFCLVFVGIAAEVLGFLAWWAILFTGKYPEGWFHFVEGYYRWSARVGLYFYYCDVYPPFSTK
jgi:hypothetical protein